LPDLHSFPTRRSSDLHFAEGQVITVVRTDIGSVHGNYGGIYFEDELQGELKASPDGAKIASAVFSDYRPFDLFDFNTSTGILSRSEEHTSELQSRENL